MGSGIAEGSTENGKTGINWHTDECEWVLDWGASIIWSAKSRTLSSTDSSYTSVERDIDDSGAGSTEGIALSRTENSSTCTDGNADEWLVTVGAFVLDDLVALGNANESSTNVDWNTDETIGGGQSVADCLS